MAKITAISRTETTLGGVSLKPLAAQLLHLPVASLPVAATVAFFCRLGERDSNSETLVLLELKQFNGTN